MGNCQALYEGANGSEFSLIGLKFKTDGDGPDWHGMLVIGFYVFGGTGELRHQPSGGPVEVFSGRVGTAADYSIRVSSGFGSL